MKKIIGYTLIFIICFSFMGFALGLFKIKPMAILSNSMQPTVNRGDLVIFKKLDFSKLQNIENNTIIVYKEYNRNIIHWVIKKVIINGKVGYITKGDNNPKVDLKIVYPEDILGIYAFSLKYLGYPMVWLNSL